MKECFTHICLSFIRVALASRKIVCIFWQCKRQTFPVIMHLRYYLLLCLAFNFLHHLMSYNLVYLLSSLEHANSILISYYLHDLQKSMFTKKTLSTHLWVFKLFSFKKTQPSLIFYHLYGTLSANSGLHWAPLILLSLSKYCLFSDYAFYIVTFSRAFKIFP